MVSISTVGVLLDFEAGRARLRADATAALMRIAKRADVYLVTTLPEDSDACEAAALEAMTHAGLFAEDGCEPSKAMFCSTEDGRSAMARQLAPSVHIDTSPKVLQYLAPHLKSVVYVDAASSPLENADGLVRARSLADYAEVLGCGGPARA